MGFLSSIGYELNICLLFCGGFDWKIFSELILFDLVENVFHLWSLSRAPISENAGQKEYIISALIMREFAEVTVPMQVLLVLNVMYNVQPRFFHFVCNMTPGEMKQAQQYLALDALIEAVIAIFTCVFLRRRGERPLDMLRGFVSMHFATMSA